MNTHRLPMLGALAAAAWLACASAEGAAPSGRYSYPPAGGTVYDTKTKLTWQRTAPTAGYTWADAATYCGSATVSGTLGGAGWRVPTVKELQSLIDSSQPAPPFADRTAFPDAAGVFWTSTLLAGTPSAAWVVLFNSGGTLTGLLSAVPRVRCVR
jgi:hypothetical protein